MAINKVILNTITDDAEKAKPFGFEVANNNSMLLKNNSGHANWLELTQDTMLYGDASGVILKDIKDISPISAVTPSGYGKELLVPSKNESDRSLLLGHEYENSATPFDNNSGNTYNTMIFDVNNGVFRVGIANTEFNSGNCGTGSVALGQGNRASATNSKAFGDNNSVDVLGSIVIGNSNNTNGHNSNIFGDNVELQHEEGTVIGNRSRHLNALSDFRGYSGFVTVGASLTGNGYKPIYINNNNGANIKRGIVIDTTKDGILQVKADITMIDPIGTMEVRMRRLYGSYYWSAGDSAVTVAGEYGQSVGGSGSTHRARFQSDDKEVFIEVDPDNDDLRCIALINFTIGYFN